MNSWTIQPAGAKPAKVEERAGLIFARDYVVPASGSATTRIFNESSVGRAAS